MFKVPFAGRCAAALVALSLTAAPAAALTGEDVMTKMSTKERYAYVAGAVEMSAFLSMRSGDRDRSNCIMGWFFRGGDGAVQVEQALVRFGERQAHSVVFALINRACGE